MHVIECISSWFVLVLNKDLSEVDLDISKLNK